MEDKLTQEQMSEKTKWFDTIRDLGFFLEGYIKNSPNSTSSWRHKSISGLVVRLGLITDKSHPHYDHFEAVMIIEWTWPEGYLYMNAENPDKLRKLYGLNIGAK